MGAVGQVYDDRGLCRTTCQDLPCAFDLWMELIYVLRFWSLALLGN